LDGLAVGKIRTEVTGWALVYKYTVLVPVEEILEDKTRRRIASIDDLLSLELMLVDHFGGITTGSEGSEYPDTRGTGARNPQKASESREVNEHSSFTAYAARCAESDAFFKELQNELQDALQEGVILIERQEAVLL
jgi:hypothetical protein